jgi:hypothetical protein
VVVDEEERGGLVGFSGEAGRDGESPAKKWTLSRSVDMKVDWAAARNDNLNRGSHEKMDNT